MRHSDTRVPRLRWNALGKMAAMIGVAAIIGFTTMSPAKADDDDWGNRSHWRNGEWRENDWRERREEWREHHRPYAYGYYYSYPSYSYSYSYPSYSYSYSYSYPSYSYSYSYPSYSYAYPYGYYDYDYSYYH